MKKTAFALAALAICGISSAQVVGSTTDLGLTGFSVKGGGLLSVDSDLRDFSKTLGLLGVEYRIPTSFLHGGETSLSADFIFKSLSGDRGTIVPILINQKWFLKSPEGGKRKYAVLGAGVSIVDISTSNSVFTLKGAFGVELSDQIFVEAVGYISEKSSSDARINSIGLVIGYKF